MPYFGLLDRNGKEIRGAGYHRLDAAEFRFKMSPGKDGGPELSFINLDPIMFPAARENWPIVACIAIYDEIDSRDPIAAKPLLDTIKCSAGDHIGLAPSFMQITWWSSDRKSNEIGPMFAEMQAKNYDLREYMQNAYDHLTSGDVEGAADILLEGLGTCRTKS